MTETPADEERAPEHTPDPVPEPPVAEAPETDVPQADAPPATGSAAEAAPDQDPAATTGAPDESATESGADAPGQRVDATQRRRILECAMSTEELTAITRPLRLPTAEVCKRDA